MRILAEEMSIEDFNKGRVTLEAITRSTPVVAALEKEENLFGIIKEGNRYDIFDAMVRTDPELKGAVVTIAFMSQRAYAGVVMKVGASVEEAENDVLKEAREFAETMKFKNLFYDYAERMYKHGDIVEQIIWEEGVGITDLMPLPMNKMTALESRAQLEKGEEQVIEASIYVFQENMPSMRQIYDAENIIHVSVNKRANLVEDINGRLTWGIWSDSPIECLSTMERWKHNSIENDIIWRHRNVPREWHKLDLSAYDPKFFAGDQEEKVRRALIAAKAACKDYMTEIKKREADQGWITGQNIEIGYVEPKSSNYTDPNPLLQQMNSSIIAATGVPSVALGGGERSFATAYESSSYALMRAEAIAEKIGEGLLELIKMHFAKKYMARVPEDVEKLDIKLSIIMSKDKEELTRQASLMKETGVFTPNEIRAHLGFEPLTDEQKEEIKEMIESTSTHVRTPAEVGSDSRKGGGKDDDSSNFPEYPGEKKEQQVV